MYEEIIKDLQELQGKTISNADYWTIQMCIEIVRKYQEAENERTDDNSRL